MNPKPLLTGTFARLDLDTLAVLAARNSGRDPAAIVALVDELMAGGHQKANDVAVNLLLEKATQNPAGIKKLLRVFAGKWAASNKTNEITTKVERAYKQTEADLNARQDSDSK